MIDQLILLRGVHIAASVFAAGTVFFLTLVADPAVRAVAAETSPGLVRLRHQLVALIWIALVVAVLSGIGWLILLASDILNMPIVDVCLNGGAWSVLAETRFGLVWSVRLALALLLGMLVLRPATHWMQMAVGASLIASLALVGHSGATPGLAGRFNLAADMGHLLAAGMWLGALPAFAMLLAHARLAGGPLENAVAMNATKRFSLLGIVSVAALLASGLFNSWNLLAGPRDLIGTDYGRLLLLKIGLFIAMVGIATVNRLHLTPRMGDPTVVWALQRNSWVEIGLGLCVFLFVGALGSIAPTAHIHSIARDIPADAAFVHIHSNDAMADVTIEPGRTGQAKFTIRVSREDFSDFAVEDVRIALDPPAPGKTVEHSTVHMADGTWQIGSLDIPQPGIWTVRVIVTPTGGTPVVLDAPVVIEP